MFKRQPWNISRQNGGSAAGHSARRMTPRCQAVFVACSAAALAYTLYCCVDETGPVGYAMKLELDLFGRAEVYQAASLVIGGWYLGLMMIAGIIGQFVPSLVYTDSPHQFQINRPSRPMSWKRILGISAIPILIAAVIAPGVYVLMHRDDQKMVYDLDLTSGAAAPPRHAKFVNVTGVIAKPYVMSLKSVSDTAVVHWRYAPITEAGWTPRDPIRYVVAIAAGETSDYQVAWPVALQKSGVTRFSGSLGGSLSTIVESGFRSKGLKLADSYSVLSMRDLEDTSTFGWEDVLVLISLGAMLSLIAFAVLVKVRFANSRQSA